VVEIARAVLPRSSPTRRILSAADPARLRRQLAFVRKQLRLIEAIALDLI